MTMKTIPLTDELIRAWRVSRVAMDVWEATAPDSPEEEAAHILWNDARLDVVDVLNELMWAAGVEAI